MDITSLNLFSESVEKNIDYEITLSHYNNLHHYIENNICRIGYSPEVFCEDAKDFFQKAGDVFRNIIEVIVRFFKTVWNTIVNWVLNLFSKKRKEQLEKINEKIDEIIKGIDEKLKGVKKDEFEANENFCQNEFSDDLQEEYGLNPIIKALRNMIFAKRDGSLGRFKNAFDDFKVEIKSPDFVDLFKTPSDYTGALARFHKTIFDHTMDVVKYDKQAKDGKESEERKEQALDALSRIIKNLEIIYGKSTNLTKEDETKEEKIKNVPLPDISSIKLYRESINSIKKCYPMANNMFNLIARYYGEKEPNDIKWEPLEDLKEIKERQNSYSIENIKKEDKNDIFIKRICSTILIKNQTALSHGVIITKKIEQFLVNITKVITKIKEDL